MAESDSAPWRQTACVDAVAGSSGGFTWAVSGGRWEDLPAHVAALVAPPVVVSARSRTAAAAVDTAPPVHAAAAVATAQPIAAQPIPVADAVPPAGSDRQPESRAERRLELVLFPPDRSMIAPGQARAGRHRRPARAS